MNGFSSISPSLTPLTKKKAIFEWMEACAKSFQELKDRVTSAPVLTLPKWGENYTMYSDAYRVGFGWFLMQGGKVITYMSRKLKDHENDYPTHYIE